MKWMLFGYSPEATPSPSPTPPPPQIQKLPEYMNHPGWQHNVDWGPPPDRMKAAPQPPLVESSNVEKLNDALIRLHGATVGQVSQPIHDELKPMISYGVGELIPDSDWSGRPPPGVSQVPGYPDPRQMHDDFKHHTQDVLGEVGANMFTELTAGVVAWSFRDLGGPAGGQEVGVIQTFGNPTHPSIQLPGASKTRKGGSVLHWRRTSASGAEHGDTARSKGIAAPDRGFGTLDPDEARFGYQIDGPRMTIRGSSTQFTPTPEDVPAIKEALADPTVRKELSDLGVQQVVIDFDNNQRVKFPL